MKYIFYIVFILPVLLKGQSLNTDSLITKACLQETVSFLSADTLQGRLTGSQGAVIAANFIADKFSLLGLHYMTGHDNYHDTFPARIYGKKITGVNVIGLIPSSTGNDTMIIFSAHYDHIGKGDDLEYNKDYRNDDEIFNGANDDATGVAALLGLAKYFSAKKSNHYNIAFIAFAGEELGMVGSTDLADRINTKKLKAVINLEMLGRPAHNNCYIISLSNRKLRTYLNDELKNAGVSGDKKFFSLDPYYDEDLAHRSDHYPFARKIKNAFTIMATSPKDKFYHTVEDEYDTIDFDFLLEATKNIALASEYFTK